jgi:hypothetical protein
MDIQPTNQQPISDDQELAKVLAGITAGADGAVPTDIATGIEQEAAAMAPQTDVAAMAPVTPAPVEEPIMPVPAPEPTFVTPSTVPAPDSGLEAIKHDALSELRPLVDKLNLSAEEKFDTLLLLIRSTDDTTLVGPAFEAARSIADETEKAQALLDIVKEIDYLSNPQK